MELNWNSEGDFPSVRKPCPNCGEPASQFDIIRQHFCTSYVTEIVCRNCGYLKTKITLPAGNDAHA